MVVFPGAVIKNTNHYMEMWYQDSKSQRVQLGLYGEWGPDFIFMGVSFEFRAGLGVGGRDQMTLQFMTLREQWLFMIFPFSLFLVPLAGSTHCSPAPSRSRGQWRVQKRMTFFSLLIFLELCWWWRSLGTHLHGRLCSYQELWNFHNQDAACPIDFSVLFPKEYGIRRILSREGD